ncbi:MAG: acyl-CoA dehydrogenase family protein, partial [Pseudomonadales bacterium]|nr:acyl-CoA dehydrogenase family protein [Pseudomonadales bacterium]
MSDLETFRKETRAWLEENCTESMRTPGSEDETVWGGRRETFKNPDSKVWLERMAGKGWTCPTWPKEYGGGGLSHQENMVLQQELMRIHARQPLVSFGISMLGPVLLEYGTEEQKQEHIPKIIRGEIRWCQGYSEPGAGSDLAGLQTKAVLEGDEFIVNGQKIWTSYADQADWMFCLVRTDFEAPKHSGISFVLFDMESPGVSTRPIKLISGNSPFCETFLEDVHVPRKNLLGEMNEGWTIAKKLLQHERTMISGMGSRGRGSPERSMENLAKKYVGEADGRVAHESLRDDISQHKMNGEEFSLTVRRAGEEA